MMSYTLIDFFNGFQNLKRIKRFSAGVQSTYFAILAEFYLRHFPDELELSTRDLKSLAGLKSVSSAHEARNILKNNKLVDFHTRNGISVYTLGTDHLPNTSRTITEHETNGLPNGNRTPDAPVCYAPNYTHAGASTDTNADETAAEPPSLPALPPTPPIPPILSPCVPPCSSRVAVPPQPSPPLPTPPPSHTRAGPLRSPIFDPNDIHDIWLYETGQPLKGSVAYELEQLANNDFDGVHNAIIQAVKANSKDTVSFNFFKAVYESMKNPNPITALKEKEKKKEGELSGGYHYQYKLPPKYDIDFDED